MNGRLRAMAKRVPGATTAAHLINQARQARQQPETPAGSEHNATLEQQVQLMLLTSYRDQFRRGQAPFEAVREAGFRCYSQFDEDGILLYLLAALGMKTRRVVEIGCGDGTENLSTNLVLNHGFEGYLFDGSAANIAHAEDFFAHHRDAAINRPEVRQAWITRDNVNDLLTDAGASGEVDVFSLDIDGNDWHVWRAIEVLNPRICVLETHDIIPGHLSLTIPYSDDFNCWAEPRERWDFRSASLLAMQRLAATKGYRMVGAHRHGFNVFFVREDLGADLFPEVSIASIHDNPWTRKGQQERWPVVEHLPWIEV